VSKLDSIARKVMMAMGIGRELENIRTPTGTARIHLTSV